jgi:D-glycero-D-manno-heptose 1,7-bisphosphate phosphatase
MSNQSSFHMPFGSEIDSDGLWCQVLNRSQGTGLRPALFLDRDGVIVEEVHYLHRPEDARLIDGASEVIARANCLAVPVIIVTNQAGIGYGKYRWQEFADVQEKILDELSDAGAYVNAVFACPFHATGKPPYQHPNHPGRKPNPGMMIRAAEMLPITLSGSWIIGDRANDLLAGKNAGLSGGMHVRTGHGVKTTEQSDALSSKSAKFDVVSGDSIAGATERLPLLAS